MLLLVILILVLYALIKNYRQTNYNLPKGPPSIPLLGSISFFVERGTCIPSLVTEKKFSVYSKYFTTFKTPGGGTLVVIQNFELARHLFTKNEFSGRSFASYSGPVLPYISIGKSYHGKTMGIIMTQGQLWEEQRGFTIKGLRKLGLGKQIMDTMIHEQATCAIDMLIEDSINSSVVHNVAVENQFSIPVVNALWTLMVAKRLDPDDTATKSLLQEVNNFFKDKPNNVWTQFYQIVKNVVPPYISSVLPYTDKEKSCVAIRKFCRDEIMKHIGQDNDWYEPNDFFDVYIRKIKQEEQRLGSDYNINTSNFHVEQLTQISMDFFFAGIETTSTTLKWSLLYMSMYPEVQEKCRKEINLKLGGNLQCD